MQACYLTITTSVDGSETQFSRRGEMELTPVSVHLRYEEETAKVRMKIQGEEAIIERNGDYSMRLSLKRGERTSGTLGILGNFGEIQTHTHKIVYSIGNDSLLLLMQYDLLINGEKQKMKIRLLARKLEEND